jgi:hypothetical protein
MNSISVKLCISLLLIPFFATAAESFYVPDAVQDACAIIFEQEKTFADGI